MLYLWLKTLHIVLIASWFAGLFYLPRIFVNLADEMASVPLEQAANPVVVRLLAMAHRLFRFMTVLAVPAVLTGVWLWVQFFWGSGAWIHAKLTLVLVIALYHAYCWRVIDQFRAGTNLRSHVWFRWFNELPVLLMLAIVVLVVFKPF